MPKVNCKMMRSSSGTCEINCGVQTVHRKTSIFIAKFTYRYLAGARFVDVSGLDGRPATKRSACRHMHTQTPVRRMATSAIRVNETFGKSLTPID